VATGAPLPTVAETRAHHAYSPSTLQSLESCPLYQSRQNVKEHERTTAGTRAHNAADSETDDERLSDEDAAAVAECLDYVDALKQQLAKAANAAFLAGPAGAPIPKDFQEINEPYLPIDDLIFPDCKSTTAGYADKILISYCGTIAHVADYKFGMWPVTHAKENLQGIAYALGVFKRWPKIQEITIHFLQPLLNAKTSATLFRSDIPSHYFRICAVVARARVAREQLAKELAAKQEPSYEQATPNVPTCSFCDHLGKCKKALAIAIQVGHKFSPLDIPADLTPTMIHNDKDTSMAMKLAMVVATWAKAFRTVITNRVINGDAEVPEGFTIVSQEKRELVDLAAYRKAAIKIIGAKAFEETLQTTFGAVEKLIAEKAPRGIKTKVVEAFKHETEESGCVTRSLPITFLKAIPKKEAE
jgi:phosphohistidine phosphatase SixA